MAGSHGEKAKNHRQKDVYESLSPDTGTKQFKGLQAERGEGREPATKSDRYKKPRVFTYSKAAAN